ncbi:MAG: winged helix-turn-helix domain-containing protein [Candidatus Jordarchaeaceae archaeon]
MSPVWKKKLQEAKAILRKKKNITPGIETRTLILKQIRQEAKTISEIAKALNMSYMRVLSQLRNMEKEGIVKRTKEKPHQWYLTGIGQQVLR